MQKTYTSMIGMPVVDANSGILISLVRDIIIDPDKGKVLAFKVHKKKIIVPFDIERINNAIYLNDSLSIIDTNEVPRVEEVAQEKLEIFGASVITQQKKKYLGRVIDYSIETHTFTLESLYIAKFFLVFRYGERIIAARRIIKVEPGIIWVEEDQEVVKESIPSVAPTV